MPQPCGENDNLYSARSLTSLSVSTTSSHRLRSAKPQREIDDIERKQQHQQQLAPSTLSVFSNIYPNFCQMAAGGSSNLMTSLHGVTGTAAATATATIQHSQPITAYKTSTILTTDTLSLLSSHDSIIGPSEHSSTNSVRLGHLGQIGHLLQQQSNFIPTNLPSSCLPIMTTIPTIDFNNDNSQPSPSPLQQEPHQHQHQGQDHQQQSPSPQYQSSPQPPPPPPQQQQQQQQQHQQLPPSQQPTPYIQQNNSSNMNMNSTSSNNYPPDVTLMTTIPSIVAPDSIAQTATCIGADDDDNDNDEDDEDNENGKNGENDVDGNNLYQLPVTQRVNSVETQVGYTVKNKQLRLYAPYYNQDNNIPNKIYTNQHVVDASAATTTVTATSTVAETAGKITPVIATIPSNVVSHIRSSSSTRGRDKLCVNSTDCSDADIVANMQQIGLDGESSDIDDHEDHRMRMKNNDANNNKALYNQSHDIDYQNNGGGGHKRKPPPRRSNSSMRGKKPLHPPPSHIVGGDIIETPISTTPLLSQPSVMDASYFQFTNTIINSSNSNSNGKSSDNNNIRQVEDITQDDQMTDQQPVPLQQLIQQQRHQQQQQQLQLQQQQQQQRQLQQQQQQLLQKQKQKLPYSTQQEDSELAYTLLNQRLLQQLDLNVKKPPSLMKNAQLPPPDLYNSSVPLSCTNTTTNSAKAQLSISTKSKTLQLNTFSAINIKCLIKISTASTTASNNTSTAGTPQHALKTSNNAMDFVISVDQNFPTIDHDNNDNISNNISNAVTDKVNISEQIQSSLNTIQTTIPMGNQNLDSLSYSSQHPRQDYHKIQQNNQEQNISQHMHYNHIPLPPSSTTSIMSASPLGKFPIAYPPSTTTIPISATSNNNRHLQPQSHQHPLTKQQQQLQMQQFGLCAVMSTASSNTANANQPTILTNHNNINDVTNKQLFQFQRQQQQQHIQQQQQMQMQQQQQSSTIPIGSLNISNNNNNNNINSNDFVSLPAMTIASATDSTTLQMKHVSDHHSLLYQNLLQPDHTSQFHSGLHINVHNTELNNNNNNNSNNNNNNNNHNVNTSNQMNNYNPADLFGQTTVSNSMLEPMSDTISIQTPTHLQAPPLPIPSALHIPTPLQQTDDVINNENEAKLATDQSALSSTVVAAVAASHDMAPRLTNNKVIVTTSSKNFHTKLTRYRTQLINILSSITTEYCDLTKRFYGYTLKFFAIANDLETWKLFWDQGAQRLSELHTKKKKLDHLYFPLETAYTSSILHITHELQRLGSDESLADIIHQAQEKLLMYDISRAHNALQQAAVTSLSSINTTSISTKLEEQQPRHTFIFEEPRKTDIITNNTKTNNSQSLSLSSFEAIPSYIPCYIYRFFLSAEPLPIFPVPNHLNYQPKAPFDLNQFRLLGNFAEYGTTKQISSKNSNAKNKTISNKKIKEDDFDDINHIEDNLQFMSDENMTAPVLPSPTRKDKSLSITQRHLDKIKQLHLPGMQLRRYKSGLAEFGKALTVMTRLLRMARNKYISLLPNETNFPNDPSLKPLCIDFLIVDDDSTLEEE